MILSVEKLSHSCLLYTSLGRMICGWLCPFGWAQELLDKLPMLKLSKNKITYYLSYFKYVVLLLFACDLYFFDLHGLDLSLIHI